MGIIAKIVDCLIIGTNQLGFQEEERRLRLLGTSHAAYRELSTSFIEYENQKLTAQDVYNQLIIGKEKNRTHQHFSCERIFNPTIAYLGTYLHRHGYTFDYIHWFNKERDELIDKLKRDQILTIAITTTLYPTIFPIIDIVSLIRKYNKTVKIIVGGTLIHKSYIIQKTSQLNKQFDLIGANYYIINQQGEKTLTKLIDAIKTNNPLSEIDNIVYQSNHQYHYNNIINENNKLEENMVDWKLFADRVGQAVVIRTGISCPFTCGFCLYPKLGGKYQYINVEAIESELDILEEIGTVKSIYFIDDTFNIPVKRFKEILRMMIRKKYSFKWHSFFRCQYADRETVELMKESGCQGVMLGIESGSQKILDNMNKSVSVEQYKEGIRLLNEYEIPALVSLLVGYPGETMETIQETIDFIEEVRPTFYQAYLWYAAQGTPVWQQEERFGLKGQEFNWSHNTMDVQEACDMVKHIFLTIKKSVWLPKHNFYSEGLFFLRNKGNSYEQIKAFCHLFNKGVKHKLLNHNEPIMIEEIIEGMKKCII